VYRVDKTFQKNSHLIAIACYTPFIPNEGFAMHRQLDWKVIYGSTAVFALAVALFGCAGNTVSGNSGGVTGGTATGGSTGGFASEVASVNLPDTPGLLQYAFLTGAGRAGGYEAATVRNLVVTDGAGSESSGINERRLTLTSYQSQMLSTNVPSNGAASRLFDTVQLNFVNYTSNDGTTSQEFSNVSGAPVNLTSYVRTFTGRHTHIPIYMDGETINIDNSTGSAAATFNSDWFNQINQVNGDSVITRGFVSDFISFDVSSLPAAERPQLSNGYGVADRVFFSGDMYAMGNGNSVAGGAPFELIYAGGQVASVVGKHSSPATLPGGSPVGVTPGTYTTLGIDPTDVSTLDPVLAKKITGFQGIWKPHFVQRLNPSSGIIEDLGYLKNVHAFEAIALPGSADDARQDVVFFTQTISSNTDGTKSASITGLRWGYLDLETNEILIYPLANLTDVDTGTNLNGEIKLNITGKFTATGNATQSAQSMRYVGFSYAGGAALPAGFPTTGKIVVVRR
jgi:hypothetical protein